MCKLMKCHKGLIIFRFQQFKNIFQDHITEHKQFFTYYKTEVEYAH